MIPPGFIYCRRICSKARHTSCFLKIKNRNPQMRIPVSDRSVMIRFQELNKFDSRPHPQGVCPEIERFSHSLKTCRWHVFLTAFRIPTLTKRKKKTAQVGSLLFWSEYRDSNPRPLGPELNHTCLISYYCVQKVLIL